MDIGISSDENISESIFTNFINTISKEELTFKIEPRETGRIYASIEQLIPTAIILYIGKSYFDSFLKEMGKEHYHLLKKAFYL